MNIAVAQSGGPTCAINASLVGVIKEAFKTEEIETVYGSVNGIEGIIKGNVINLNEVITSDEDFKLLKQTPSSALGSCRYKLPSQREDKEVYETIRNFFEENNIKAFFYIGGNDSMDTVVKLSKYFKKIGSDVRVVGVPKTIDNDLMNTDHTPGFGSAAKFVVSTVNEIICDSSVYDLDSVTIIEVMGRQAGWLAASTCVLRTIGENMPQLIYPSECNFKIRTFIDDIRRELKMSRSVVVVISEGVEIGSDVGKKTYTNRPDGFGHKNLGGIAKQLEQITSLAVGCKVRSVELNVLQRCASHFASSVDIEESESAGKVAVREMLAGKTGIMIAFERISDQPYKINIKSVKASEVANFDKPLPAEWINKENNNIRDEAIKYFLPLIQGEYPVITENGIPKHFKFDK